MAQTDSEFRLDIRHMLSEVQHRWLRPSEVSEILRNHSKFQISPEAPTKPVSGSVFLFDRKVLRYFRKDGHNWRKKKDGKTVREAHEKLKVGSVDMLHCYYAHGEDNENFQRRSYWLLEQDLMNIVFVHYLEVKGTKTSTSVRNSNAMISGSENGSPLASSFRGTSPTSTLSSGYVDAESEDSHQASSRVNAYSEFPMTVDSHSVLAGSYSQTISGNQSISALSYDSPSPDQRYGIIGGGNIPHGALTEVDSVSSQGHCSTGETAYKQESVNNWQHSFGDSSSQLRIQNMNQNVVLNSPQDNGSTLFEGKSLPSHQENTGTLYASTDELKELSELSNFQVLLSDGMAVNPNLENVIENESYSFLKKPLISGLQTGDSLKKVDSFSSWIANELLETDDINMHSSCGIPWSEFESDMTAQLQADIDALSPSVSHDQLFSIIDFSPNLAYSNLETKVLIMGSFLKSEEELSKCKWSVMFGEVEVPAEILANGILCCRAPLHKPGVVPFYLTCSNRLCCSELREFEYRLGPDHIISSVDGSGDYVIVMHLYQRFEMILGLSPVGSPVSSSGSDLAKENVINKIHMLMEEDNDEAVSMPLVNDKSQPKLIGQLLIEKQMKQKFYSWLLHRVYEDGEGITALDERGQTVLHLAAALGFNWVFQPIIVSGVSIDFRDRNGWNALHWAAFYGREETVALLVALGADPGALTNPSVEHPCKTPADLASSSGHKGISGYLAEAILTTHLSKLDVDDQHDGATDVPRIDGVQTVSERVSVPVTGHDVPDTLSLKDSLAAVCNAAQAAARIHQIFRLKSFQRKQLSEEGSDELLTSDERAISLMAGKKASRFYHIDGMASSAAALQIQKKFRGWKKRKEFLLIRQKIVKIQAHVRGHQARKKYKSVAWSVKLWGMAICWRRGKRSGFRGFRPDGVVKEGANAEGSSQSNDDYDYLKKGRNQSEERMQKALSRVKSMAQYPEARAQYRRLLTTAEGLRETKDASPSNSEEMIYPEDDLIDIEALLNDDAFMSQAFQ